MHFQDALKQAKEIQENDKVAMVVYLDPYAEYESDQIGYCPLAATDMFLHYIILATISANGRVRLTTAYYS